MARSYRIWRRRRDVTVMLFCLISGLLLIHATLHASARVNWFELEHVDVVRVGRVLLLSVALLMFAAIEEHIALVAHREGVVTRMMEPLERLFEEKNNGELPT
jgi:hypothetical protein